MREILFRGKKLDNGQWTYGLPTYDMEYVFGENDFDSPDSYMVDVNTVGQHIGFSDKNGVKIFEGDIIEEGYNNMVGRWTTKKWIVKWNQIEMAWMCYDNEISPYPTRASIVCTNKNVIEVIGNIHDNRNLLK